jgi:hypothetical protein
MLHPQLKGGHPQLTGGLPRAAASITSQVVQKKDVDERKWVRKREART